MIEKKYEKKRAVALIGLGIILICLIVGTIIIFSNKYIQFKLNYSSKNYEKALNEVLQLKYDKIIEIVNKLKEEDTSFAIEILTQIDDSLISEEILDSYVEISKQQEFDKKNFNRIIDKIEKIDINFENIKSKEIVYNFCNSYIQYLENKEISKTMYASEYDVILGYLNRISDYKDSIEKINKLNFELARSYLEKGKRENFNYDLMIKYFDIIDEKYLEIIDRNNIRGIANIFLEIAEKYSKSTMYAYSEQYYEKAIKILKINEDENKLIIKEYESKYLEEKKKSKAYEWCEAYGCARKKSIGNLHYCQIHDKNPRALTPVATDESKSESEYSLYHKCEVPDCSNYASRCKYCSKHKKWEENNER